MYPLSSYHAFISYLGQLFVKTAQYDPDCTIHVSSLIFQCAQPEVYFCTLTWHKVCNLLYTHTLEFEDSMKTLAKILDGRNIKLTRVEKIIDVTDTNNVDAVLRRYANQGTCV